jgi:hypothetical protein
MHTHTQIHTHTQTHTHTHTHTRPILQAMSHSAAVNLCKTAQVASTHASTHVYTQHVDTNLHSHSRKNEDTPKHWTLSRHVHTRTHSRTDTHKGTHTHSLTHTHTHTHTTPIGGSVARGASSLSTGILPVRPQQEVCECDCACVCVCPLSTGILPM